MTNTCNKEALLGTIYSSLVVYIYKAGNIYICDHPRKKVTKMGKNWGKF